MKLRRGLTLVIVGRLAGTAWLAAPASAQAPQPPAVEATATPNATPVPLAARDLPRGTVLAIADIEASAGDNAPGESVVGWVTRRVLTKGEPLRHPAIAPPDLVKSGDTVQLVWRDGSIEIRLAGKAMSSAAAGEKVSVRVDSKRRFDGVVEAKGIVRMNTPETSGR